MPATTFLLLVATVISVDGSVARIDRGHLAGLRPGDVGAFYYQLTVGSETRRIEVASGTLIETGERHALVAIDGAATVKPEHLIELKIPVSPQAGEELLRRARSAPPRNEPAAKPVPTRQVSDDPSAAEAAVRNVVMAWAKAWSEQRADDYLGFYARTFRTPDGIRRDAWETQRRLRIARPAAITVSVEQMKIVTVASKAAVATFVQSYRSDSYQDRVSKLLDFIREDGEWRILEERLVESSRQ